MRPGVLSWVETLFCGRVGVDLANEGEGAVEVGIPCDGTNSEEGRGGEGCARVGERLASGTLRREYRDDNKRKRTSNAEEEAEEERERAGREEAEAEVLDRLGVLLCGCGGEARRRRTSEVWAYRLVLRMRSPWRGWW